MSQGYVQQDKQCMNNVNTEVRSYNHCCNGKTMSITYCEFVFVALGIQHAMRMRRIVICGLAGSAIFFDIIS